jgi:hypothetical protein
MLLALILACARHDAADAAPAPPAYAFTPGPLALSLGEVSAGDTWRAEVANAAPGEKVIFLMSTGMPEPGPCSSRLGGLCLDLKRPTVVGRVVADAAGVARLESELPEQVPTGSVLSFEAVVARGEGGSASAKSNPVQVIVAR